MKSFKSNELLCFTHEFMHIKFIHFPFEWVHECIIKKLYRIDRIDKTLLSKNTSIHFAVEKLSESRENLAYF